MWSWPMVCSAQLGEWSLPTPEDPGWNPDMVNFIEQILTVDNNAKTRMEEKSPRMVHLKTIANCRREDFVQILRLKLLRFKFADNDRINSDRSSKKYGNPGIEGDS